MAEEAFLIRVRYPGGVATLDKLTSGSNLRDLKVEVANLTNKTPGEIAVRLGFPPVPVTASDDTPLIDLGVTTGDQIIAEFQESEEAKEQKAKAQQQKANTNSQTQQKPISLDSTNKGGQQNFQPQGNQGANNKDSKFAEDLALSQEEYDQQLARALAESMGGQGNDVKGNQFEEENLFEPQNSNKKPEPKPINTVDIGAQKSNSNVDDDEYARKLQEELYAEGFLNAEQPRQQNADTFDAGVYGGQQYNQPLLGQNIDNMTNPFSIGGFGGNPIGGNPLGGNPLGGNPFGGGMNAFPGGNALGGGVSVGGGGGNRASADDEALQRAIQESLDQKPAQSNTEDDDEELRQALEASKKSK